MHNPSPRLLVCEPLHQSKSIDMPIEQSLGTQYDDIKTTTAKPTQTHDFRSKISEKPKHRRNDSSPRQKIGRRMSSRLRRAIVRVRPDLEAAFHAVRDARRDGLGWQRRRSSTTGVTIARKSGQIKATKGEGILECSVHEARTAIMNLAMIAVWDKKLQAGRVVSEDTKNNTKTLHLTYSLPWPCKARDLVVHCQEVKYVRPDGRRSIVFVSTSAKHQDIPAVKGIVRAQLRYAGWILEPAGDDLSKCRVTYVRCVDLGGGIPTLINNTVGTSAEAVVARLAQQFKMRTRKNHEKSCIPA
ncbi:hypothetical protein AAMO2058_001700400 [Amorphochlora amoebiformis]